MSRKINVPAGVSAIACPPGTLPGGPTRTRFFDGMFLSQADLENEQRYFRLKRRLTNRALGQGVVWGLRLEWQKTSRQFTLSPGYALDCCGNDLVVECPVVMSEQQLWATAEAALRAPPAFTPAASLAAGAVSDAVGVNRDSVHACVILQYAECPEEARPVHRDACAGPTGYCEPSRIRESTRLLLVPAPRTVVRTPPEQFLDELYSFRDGLPPQIRELLFPSQGTPAPTPGSGTVPLQLRATVPGNTLTPSGATTSLQVPGSGSVTAANTLTATQTPSAGRRTGVVTFELNPSSGWSLTAGKVSDQARTVETVTPPAAPSMFWSFDIALPDGAQAATAQVDFLLDELELTQTFGGNQHGRVRAHVTGLVRAVGDAANAAVNVSLEQLTITTERAEVFEDTNGQGCLRELIPWGWTVDPRNGSKIARTLVLAALYSFLSETVSRGSSPALKTLAAILYALGWYVLFGVNAVAPTEESYRRKLAELLLKLYARWCDGFAYPGPRCADAHHGIYLGCMELTRSGVVQSFDMWEHRRYVLTGPLLNHWAAQFGIAPLDVIVSRFARAICCLAGLPPIALPASEGGLSGFRGGRFHVGTVETVKAFALERGAKLSWVGPAVLSQRSIEGFVARDEAGPVQVLATQLPDGGSVAVAVPADQRAEPPSKVRGDVVSLLRQGEFRARARTRDTAADFTLALLREAPATAALPQQPDEATGRFVEALAKNGATLADLAEGGADSALVRAGLGDSKEMRNAADTLVDAAEVAVERIAQTTVKVLGPTFEAADFAATPTQKKLAEAITNDRTLSKIPATAVINAATLIAKQGARARP